MDQLKRKISFCIITVSDRCSRGDAIDTSGPALKAVIQSGIIDGGVIVSEVLVPDEFKQIQDTVSKLCKDVDAIILTGGTGPAQRDVTVEAVNGLLDKNFNGCALAILLAGLKETPFAALSRCLVGSRGNTLIACLPGSTKGALCALRALAPVVGHAVDLLNGRTENVTATHVKCDTKTVEREIFSKVVITENEADYQRQSIYPMTKMEDANKIVLDVCSVLPTVTMPSMNAMGRVLADDVTSWESIPPVRTSMKDGYAVKSGGENPFKVIDECRPGSKCLTTLGVNEAVKVSTGSSIPEGTDCVVPIEDTSFSSDGYINISKSPVCGADIRPIGSDLKAGVIVLRKNTIIKSPEIGLLASIGQSAISVVRCPVVALLSTGDEVQDPWGELNDSQIRDSNRPMLKSLVESWGFKVIDLGIVTDDPSLILKKLIAGFDQADVVVTTGGMSMGQRDLMKQILITDLNATIHFGRLKMKPGKPTAFATLPYKGVKKYWMGLPGNPASAYVTSSILLLPVLRILSGWTESCFLKFILAKIKSFVAADPERISYVRGKLHYDNNSVQFNVTPLPDQQSSSLLGCLQADCLLEVRTDLKEYSSVRAYLLPDI